MGKIDLSIVIVSFNTRDLTIDCINSIVNTTKKINYEIIVVDNASTDGSADAIRSLQKKLKIDLILFSNNVNTGFSSANNIGAMHSRGEYVLFLNSDTVVYEKTIDGMVDFMDKHTDCGAATCFLRMPNGKLDDAAHRGFPTPWRSMSHFMGLSKIFPKSKFFAGYSMTYSDLSKTHEIDALAGAFMIVRREAGYQVQWWDEGYFFYGEDLDFCYSLKELGWKIFFVPEFEILHYKGVSGGIKKDSQKISTATRETKKRVHDARFAAMQIFYDKHYKDKYPGVVRGIVLIGVKAKKFITGLSN